MKSLSVLVVDDDAGFAEGLSDLIRFYGHSVQHAVDADAAIAAVKTAFFDLVFLDVRMPGKSGLEAYPQIRDASPRTCIVFATAFMDDLDRQSNRQVMHADLLEKPRGISRLDKVLRRVAGEFEVLLVGADADVRELHQALRHRGYQVLTANSVDAATSVVTSSVGEKVAAIVGYSRFAGSSLDALDAELESLGMTLPIISVADPSGCDQLSSKPTRVQRLSREASLYDILESVDRGAELFVV